MKPAFNQFMKHLIISLFVIISSCAPSKKNMTVEHKQIPPDFRNYKGVLLIIKQTKSWNHYAEAAFTKRYTGQYILIDESELDSKYSDTDKYQFVVGRTTQSSKSGTNNFSYTSSEHLCTTDRKTEKGYCTYDYALYGKLLKSYASSLESARIGH